MVRIIYLLGLLFTLPGVALETQPLRLVTGQLLFNLMVPRPQHLIRCKDHLWTYSVSENSLYQVDTLTEQVKKTLDLGKTESFRTPTDIGALSCFQDQLLIALNRKSGPKLKWTEIWQVDLQSTQVGLSLKLVSKLSGSRMSDLFCDRTQCFGLQSKIFNTKNLKHWREIPIPEVDDIPRLGSQKDLNPFEDWQSPLVLAKSGYFRGAINDEGHLILLDPGRMLVARFVDGKWTKWGSYGAWEGSFMSPQQVAYLRNDILAIADAQLRAIFLFQTDGQYLGILARQNKDPLLLGFPSGLVAQGGRLYVADFMAERIRGFDLVGFQSSVGKSDKVNVRHNLFRRTEVIRNLNQNLCLNCHSGVSENFLHQYIRNTRHSKLTCTKCHEPHHEVRSEKYLKMKPALLCQSCHKKEAVVGHNHVWKEKKGGQCIECHRSHAEESPLLRQATESLCLSCHKEQQVRHRSVVRLQSQARAEGLVFLGDHLTCLSCHGPHKMDSGVKLVKPKQKMEYFCASCHGQKANQLFKDFHKLIQQRKGTL